MNERLQELAQQAEMFANKGDRVDVKIMMEKFSELIVRECAQAADDWYTNSDGKEISWHVDAHIKKHFGVKE